MQSADELNGKKMSINSYTQFAFRSSERREGRKERKQEY